MPGWACTDSCGSPVSYSQPEKDLLSYIYQGGQGNFLETQKAQPHSRTVFLHLCANNVDTLELTRIRRGSTISIVVCFSSTGKCLVGVCVCVFVSVQSCLPQHAAAELVPGTCKRAIVFRIGGSACKVAMGPQASEIKRELKRQCVFSLSDCVYFLDLWALAWPFS